MLERDMPRCLPQVNKATRDPITSGDRRHTCRRMLMSGGSTHALRTVHLFSDHL